MIPAGSFGPGSDLSKGETLGCFFVTRAMSKYLATAIHALSMKPSLCEIDDACFEQVALPSAIHLAFNQLKLADLSFGLPV
jgi:hypothetical protein